MAFSLLPSALCSLLDSFLLKRREVAIKDKHRLDSEIEESADASDEAIDDL